MRSSAVGELRTPPVVDLGFVGAVEWGCGFYWMDGLVVLKCDQQEWTFEEFEWTEFASRRRSETWIGGLSVNDDLEGGGVYSFDTGTPFGSDFGPYLDSQVERRYLEVLVLKTTNEAVAATTRRLTRDRGAYEIYLRHGREIPKARKELLRKFKEFKGPPCP